MLAFLIDIGGGYLLARYIKRLWLLIPAAILLGLISSVSGNMLMHFISGDIFTPGETVARIVVGAVWHPIIVILAALWWRRSARKKLASNPAQGADA